MNESWCTAGHVLLFFTGSVLMIAAADGTRAKDQSTRESKLAVEHVCLPSAATSLWPSPLPWSTPPARRRGSGGSPRTPSSNGLQKCIIAFY